MAIRIYLVDDHPKVLTLIEERLAQESDFNVVGRAFDSKLAMEAVPVAKPDIVLIDPVTPNGLDLDTIRCFSEISPSVAVVVLTTFVDTALMVELRRLGVCQILEKGIASQQLVDILREAAKNNPTQ